MKSRTLIVGYVLALALFLFGQRHPTSPTPTGFHAVVDLTHSIDPQAYVPAGGSADQVKTAARVNKEYFLGNTSSADPFETRIDAPAHFARSRPNRFAVGGRKNTCGHSCQGLQRMRSATFA